MEALKSTLYHVLELTIVVLAGWTICNIFQLQNEDTKLIISLVLAAFVKYARASNDVPLNDYVNKK